MKICKASGRTEKKATSSSHNQRERKIKDGENFE